MRKSTEAMLSEGKKIFRALLDCKNQKQAREILNKVKRVNLWGVAYYADCEYKIGSGLRKDEAIEIILSAMNFTCSEKKLKNISFAMREEFYDICENRIREYTHENAKALLKCKTAEEIEKLLSTTNIPTIRLACAELKINPDFYTYKRGCLDIIKSLSQIK